MSRCFFEWRRLADDRWWKKQLLFREREIELLEKLCGGFRNRPFVVLRKRRLRQVLRCWLSQAVRLRRKRLRLARAVRAFRSHQMLAAWNTWMEYTDVRFLNSPYLGAVLFITLGDSVPYNWHFRCSPVSIFVFVSDFVCMCSRGFSPHSPPLH